MIDRQTLAEMRLCAEMCDDYSQYCKEMEDIRRLEIELAEQEAALKAQPEERLAA